MTLLATRRFGSIVRWTLTLCVVLSLCAWLLSMQWSVAACVRHNDCLAINRGCLAMSYDYGLPWSEHPGGPSFEVRRVPQYSAVLWWGSFELYDSMSVVLFVPLWAIALACGVPAAWLWVKRRTLRPTDCQKCGYDLSATPGVSKCPECGHEARGAAERPSA